MPNPGLPKEAMQAAVDALAEHGTIARACVALNLNRATYEGRLREARRQGFTSDRVPAMVMKGQSVLRNAAGEEVARWDKTKLAGRGDDEVAHVPDPKKITKVSTYYDQLGNVAAQWVSERPEDVAREKAWEAFAQGLAKGLPRVKPTRPPAATLNDVATLYNVGDHHLGMKAWGIETGGDNYDLAISERLLADATAYLADAAPASAQAIVGFLGDFTHTDGYAPLTPHGGHLLDADSRFPKIAEAAARAMRNTVDTALAKHKRVHVVITAGNHDPVTTIWLRIALSAIYEKEPRVTIDKSPAKFHYFEWGLNLLGWTHGERLKLDTLPAIMAEDQAEAWGRTKHRYWFTGHEHHDRVKDLVGAKIETVRVLAPNDAHAAKSGYRAPRDMKAILFHREHGQTGRLIAPATMFDIPGMKKAS